MRYRRWEMYRNSIQWLVVVVRVMVVEWSQWCVCRGRGEWDGRRVGVGVGVGEPKYMAARV